MASPKDYGPRVAIFNTLTIISGGQTGVDRAALNFAIEHGFAHGGWCPLGRLAEDGKLDQRYQLEETTTSRYDQRTRWNVRDSDATLLLTIHRELSGGTALTCRISQELEKPWLQVSREMYSQTTTAGQLVREFVQRHQVSRLNVAGPRASQEPEVGQYVLAVLRSAFEV